MASLPSLKTVTYDEWLCMPEVQDAIEEVVNGEIHIMPAPKIDHAIVARQLCKAFDAQLSPETYLVLDNAFGLIIRKHPLTSRVPDLAVFERSTMIQENGYVHSPPHLLAEVLSPRNSRRDMEEKLDDYASLGVPEVWIVSPEARTVEVLRLEEGRFRRSQILAEGLLQPKLFPKVQVEVARIWPD